MRQIVLDTELGPFLTWGVADNFDHSKPGAQACATARWTAIQNDRRWPAVLAELLERDVAVRFGVDATALSSDLGPQDDISFAHPHLGHADRGDAAHARRHTVLVAHYLRAAADLLAPGGAVHLTLCGNQPRVWAVEAASLRCPQRALNTALRSSLCYGALLLASQLGAFSPVHPLRRWQINPLFNGCHSDSGFTHQPRGLYAQMILGESFEGLNLSAADFSSARGAGPSQSPGSSRNPWRKEQKGSL